ncbi:MAG: hypothetical protein OQK03_01960, partial [Colwellia sp.]|nr:hypothetical protein [Colwellia sp.]
MMKTNITKLVLKITVYLLCFLTLPLHAGFDIWIYPLAFNKTKQTWSIGHGEAVTKNQKYNNQPNFTLTGEALLFVSNKSGDFNDIYRYNISKQHITKVTNTPMESEYSPIETKSGINYVLEQGIPHQSIWSYTEDEPRKRLVNSLIPAGYFATHETLGTLIWARYAGSLYFEPKGESANES